MKCTKKIVPTIGFKPRGLNPIVGTIFVFFVLYQLLGSAYVYIGFKSVRVLPWRCFEKPTPSQNEIQAVLTIEGPCQLQSPHQSLMTTSMLVTDFGDEMYWRQPWPFLLPTPSIF